jgi:hypothetical protein
MMKRLTCLSALALISVLAVAVPARAASDRTILNVAVQPRLAGAQTVFGVPPGAALWQIDHGRVHIQAGGRVVVRTRGLTIPDSTPPNPVPQIAAAVYCDGAFAARTAPEPFSTQGDARIDQTVALPADCDRPAVLLNPVRLVDGVPTVLNAYIAFAGVN